MLSGDVVRDYPKQFVSPTKAGNASTDMCEFLPWTQKYYGVDATIPVSLRETDDACSSGQKTGPWHPRVMSRSLPHLTLTTCTERRAKAKTYSNVLTIQTLEAKEASDDELEAEY